MIGASSELQAECQRLEAEAQAYLTRSNGATQMVTRSPSSSRKYEQTVFDLVIIEMHIRIPNQHSGAKNMTSI